MRTYALLLCALAAGFVCGGCAAGPDPAGNCVKPTIAVMKFENRAPFPLGWDLGGGMKDVLVDRLVRTGRYHVIERPDLDAVLRELRFQHGGGTRPEGRAALGRLKNVQYLVKGVVTDFGHVATSRTFLGLPAVDVFGGSHRAVMGMTLYVVDVESGEIIASESIEQSVRAGDTAVKVGYRDVAFGGSSFFRKPLGRATAGVIDRAVRSISRTIAARPWVPKIAAVRPEGMVVINGGTDRGVRPGQEYLVLQAGEPIADPDTGDVLGHGAGEVLGRLRVVRVRQRYSVADVIAGKTADFHVGQPCRPIETEVAKASP